MPETETYDVWVISDPAGPVLYFPVDTGSAAPPSEHVARHRQHAVRASSPDGLIEGVWPRARQRLAGPPDRLVAEIADPEVEARRAAQRAATLARGADAAAWAPDELLAEPEPAPRPRPAPKRRSAPASSTTRRSTTPRTAAPAKKKTAPSEPEEAVCRVCFMMRRVDQLDDGVCEFCQ